MTMHHIYQKNINDSIFEVHNSMGCPQKIISVGHKCFQLFLKNQNQQP